MQLKEPERYFWELNSKTGLIERYDAITGKLVAIQRSERAIPLGEDLVEVMLPSGELVMVERGVDITALKHVVLSKQEYSPVIMEIICQKIATGGALTKICTEVGMPSYATVCRWRRIHSEIDQMLARARMDRAEYLRDKVLDEAYDADEDNIGAQKLRVDTLKWAAGKDDPNRFEAKPDKMEVSLKPTTIVVQTGIDRSMRDVREDSTEVQDVQSITHAATTEVGGSHTDGEVHGAPSGSELIGDLGE